MTTPSPLLQVRDLHVTVGERSVLHGVSCDVPPGSLAVLMALLSSRW